MATTTVERPLQPRPNGSYSSPTRSRKQSGTSSTELDDDTEDLLSSPQSTTLPLNDLQLQKRTVEDDMEDLISIPVAKALHPKRSKNDITTYLPTSSRSTSALSSYSTTSDQERARAFSPTPAPAPVTAPPPSNIPRLARSTSPEISRKPTSTPQPPPPPLIKTPTKRQRPSLEQQPLKKSSLSPSTTTSKPFPSSSSSPPSKPTPNSSPRQRAQTSNLRTRPNPNSATKSSTTTPPKPRRRSFSTTTAEERMGVNGEGEPEWAKDDSPKFFRDVDGSLGREGRADQRVLPAVAKRLEAERLKEIQDRELSLRMGWTKDVSAGEGGVLREFGGRFNVADEEEEPSNSDTSPPSPSTSLPPDETSPTPPQTITPPTTAPRRHLRQSTVVLSLEELRPQQQVWEASWAKKETEPTAEKTEGEGVKGGCCKCTIM